MKRAWASFGDMYRLFVAVAVFWSLMATSPWSSSASSFATTTLAQPPGGTRTSEGGQVTIMVTWPGESADLAFLVVMDTHAVNLDAYDLAQLAALRIGNGVEILPTTWDAPPGGHHREGTLTFPSAGDEGAPIVNADTRSLELVIRDLSGVPERVLRWEVGGSNSQP